MSRVGLTLEINNHSIYGYARYIPLYKQVVEQAADNDVFVELGSFLGMSTAAMGHFIKESKKQIDFYAVDLFELGEYSDDEHYEIVEESKETFYATFLLNIEQAGVLDYVIPIKKDSIEASKDFEDRSINFIMIDAGHTKQEVINDINAWLPKIKVGGIMSFDDLDWKSVKEAIYSIFNEKEIQVLGSTGIYRKLHV